MIYICIVTMDLKYLDNICAIAASVNNAAYDAEVYVLGNTVDVPSNELYNVVLTSHQDYVYGCAESRNILVQYILNHVADPFDPDVSFIFLDDDIVAIGGGWIEYLTEPLYNGYDITGASPRMMSQDKHGTFYSAPTDVPNPDYVSGGWCAVHSRVFDRGLQFDPDYYPNYFEDVDFCLRAKRLGFKIKGVETLDLMHLDKVNADAKAARYTHEVFKKKWSMGMIEAIRDAT